MRADQQISQLIDALKLTGGVEADRFAANADLPGAGHHVESGQIAASWLRVIPRAAIFASEISTLICCGMTPPIATLPTPGTSTSSRRNCSA